MDQLIKKIAFDKQLFLKIILCTFIFGLLAHAYCFFNTMCAGDALDMVSQLKDIEWKISIGRYLQPLNFLFRGTIVAPWLIGALSLFWLGNVAYILVKLLRFTNDFMIYGVCGLLVTNSIQIVVYAKFLHEADSFGLSLLFAVLAVYIFDKYKYGFLATPVFVMASCGLYQGYFSVTVMLFMIVLVRDIIEGSSTTALIIKSVKSVVLMVLGLVLYYVIYKVVLAVSGVSAATTYNSMDGALSFSGDIAYTVIQSQVLFFENLFSFSFTHWFGNLLYPEISVPFLMTGLIVGASFLRAIIIAVQRKCGAWNIALLVLIVACMPFGMSVVIFISDLVARQTMSCAGVFIYIFALLIWNYPASDKASGKETVLKGLGALLVGALLFQNIVIANQSYLVAELAYQSTLSIMTRIVDDIEETEGYEVGETSVVMVFGIKDNPYLYQTREGFEHLTSMKANLVLEEFNAPEYFEYVLSYPINLIVYDVTSYAEESVIDAMPCFPEDGYCQMVGDVLVVKLSELTYSYVY